MECSLSLEWSWMSGVGCPPQVEEELKRHTHFEQCYLHKQLPIFDFVGNLNLNFIHTDKTHVTEPCYLPSLHPDWREGAAGDL